MLRMLLAGVVALTVATPASAGLLGATVNVSAYFPDAATLFYDPGNAVVGASVEYPQGSYPSYNDSWEVDVSDDRVKITDTLGVGLSFAPAAFNGFILTVVSGPSIVSASIDAASTIVPVGVSVSGGRLFMNFAGVSEQAFGSGIVTFVTGDVPVPAPATPALLGMGLVALGGRRRFG